MKKHKLLNKILVLSLSASTLLSSVLYSSSAVFAEDADESNEVITEDILTEEEPVLVTDLNDGTEPEDPDAEPGDPDGSGDEPGEDPDPTIPETDLTEEFVLRFYNIALGREADEGGLENWVESLKSGVKTAADIAYGFFISEEFKNKELSNEDFVDTLYKVLMGRDADEGGKANWIDKLENKYHSREFVISRFLVSAEFKSLCEKYEITPGSKAITYSVDKNEAVAAFVARFYTVALGREPDFAGMNSWCDKLIRKTATGSDIAYGFFRSAEFTSKNLSNEDFVNTLYRTILGREADPGGLANWMEKLEKYYHSREWVISRFFQSAEFKKLCSEAKIEPGTTVIQYYRDKDEKLAAYTADLYVNALGRTASIGEIENQVKKVAVNGLTLRQYIISIVTSNEFMKKNPLNEAFVEGIYKGILFRKADTAGKNVFVNRLASGQDKVTVVNSLISSNEFKKLADKYGLVLKENGWVATSSGTRYYNKNGTLLKGWQYIDGNKYYLDPANGGARTVGWKYIDGYKFYFNSQGVMQQDLEKVMGKQSSYYLTVNTSACVVTVYAQDGDRGYTIPYKRFICSPGVRDCTIKGTFKLRQYARWCGMMGDVYGQYVTQIYGDFLFHSTWYYQRNNNYSLSVYEHNRMGTQASHGCVRLMCGDAKWIYENCGGCYVKITSTGYLPFDKPARVPAVRISGDYGYDPTNPNL